MVRRAALVLVLAVVAAAPAGADTIEDRKQSVDAQIAALGARVENTQRREASLRAQVESASSEIRALAQRVNDISIELEPLERELELRRERLRRLNELFRLQTERLKLLRRQHAIALHRLGDRVDKLYRQEQTDTLSLLLSSASFTDALDMFDYLQRIADEDKRVANEVGAAKKRVRAQREETRTTRKRHRQETRVVAVRVGQIRALRDRLAASRSGLVAAQAQRQQDLSELSAHEREELAEMEALQEVSATLAAKIQAAQASGGTGGGPFGRGLHLAGAGACHEPLRLAMGAHARGHRHRGRLRHVRSAPRPQAPSSTQAGWAATGISSSSTTAAASPRHTATSRVSQ